MGGFAAVAVAAAVGWRLLTKVVIYNFAPRFCAAAAVAAVLCCVAVLLARRCILNCLCRTCQRTLQGTVSTHNGLQWRSDASAAAAAAAAAAGVYCYFSF